MDFAHRFIHKGTGADREKDCSRTVAQSRQIPPIDSDLARFAIISP